MIVFLIILAILVLLFTAYAKITITVKDELSLSVSILGIKINILPKKPKKYNLKKYTLKKIAKRDRKKAKADAAKAAKKAAKKRKKASKKPQTPEEIKAMKAAKKAGRPAIPDMISLFSRILGMFFSSFLSHFHFHITRIRINVGSPDAAQTALLYSGICTVLKPTLTFLDRHSNLHGMKNADIYIQPDFTADHTSIDIKIGFSMNLFGLLSVLFKAGINFITGWLKIKPATASDTKKDSSEKEEKKNTQALSEKS